MLYPGPSDRGRFLHDVAHLAGHAQAFLSGIGYRLDNERISAHACPGESDGRSGTIGFLHVVIAENRLSEHLLDQRIIGSEFV